MERGYGRPGKCKFRTSYMYMYVFCPNWDTTGTRPIIPGLSRPFRMVGNYANKDYTLNNNIFMHIQCTRTGVTCQKVCMHVTVDNCFKNMCMKTSFCSILKVTKWPANSSLKKHWVVCTMVHSVSDLQPLSPPPLPVPGNIPAAVRTPGSYSYRHWTWLWTPPAPGPPGRGEDWCKQSPALSSPYQHQESPCNKRTKIKTFTVATSTSRAITQNMYFIEH